MKKIIWAVVFILFDFNLTFDWGTLHLLPSVVGYILLLLSLGEFNKLGADRGSWPVMMPIFIVISTISFLVDLVGWANIDSVMYIILIFANILIRVIAVMSVLFGMENVRDQLKLENMVLGYSFIAIILVGFCYCSSVLAMSVSALSTFLWVVAVLLGIGIIINLGVELNGVKEHLEKQNDNIGQVSDDVQDIDNTQQVVVEAQDTDNI